MLGTIGSHAVRAGKSLHDSGLVDRLVRGRGWVGLLGLLLIGLVALNVGLLKMNAQAGRNAEQARKLRIANTELRGRVTRLSSAERLEAQGLKLGLVMPPPGNIHYLVARGDVDGRAAARRIAQGAFSGVGGTLVSAPTAATDPSQVAGDPVAAGQTTVDPTSGAAATDPSAQTPQSVTPTDATSTGGGTVPPAATATPDGT
ncbi:MAG: hypothetical protein WBC33_03570, partial [Conexibacter sp.]